MDIPKVSVLMSTYNGEKYLREQIESILSQKDVQIELLIRDDGSKDQTVSIIRKYASEYPNIAEYEGSNIGVGLSFMELLEKAPVTDYYAFADQDDVWLENKLIRAIEFIQNASENGMPLTAPILYTSNQILVDQNLNVLMNRFQEEPPHDLLHEISRNHLSGCTMVMNSALRDILLRKEYKPSDDTITIRLHDTWCLIVANIMGYVLYDENGYILYRQHENNVVGAKKMSTMQIIHDKINRLKLKKYKGQRSHIAQEIIAIFFRELGKDDLVHINHIAKSNSPKGFCELMKDSEARSSLGEIDYVLLFKSILGWI